VAMICRVLDLRNNTLARPMAITAMIRLELVVANASSSSKKISNWVLRVQFGDWIISLDISESGEVSENPPLNTKKRIGSPSTPYF
jgi:hypothetical protein